MTVENVSVRSGPYIPDAITTVFPFQFRAISTDDVRVIRVASDGTETEVSSALYDVTLTGEGGSAIFSTAPAAGDPLYVELDPTFLQGISFENEGAFLPEVLTEGLDRSAIQSLYLLDLMKRSFALPFDPAARLALAGQFPIINPDGTLGFSPGTGNDPTLRSQLAVNGGAYVAVRSTLLQTAIDSDGAIIDGYALPADGVDRTPAIQRTHDGLAAAGGRMKLLPATQYRLSSVNISKSVRIEGSTLENDSQFVASNGAGTLLNVAGASGVQISDLSFITSVTRTAVAPYLKFQQSYRSGAQRFRMDGHSLGIALDDVSAGVIKEGTFAFALPDSVLPGTGSIKVGEAVYAGKTSYRDLYFTSQQSPDVYHDSYQPTFGMQFYNVDNQLLDGCFFAYQGTHLSFVPKAGQASTNIDINNCTFDYCRRNHLFAPAGGSVAHVRVKGGLIAFSHLMGGVAMDSTGGEITNISYTGVNIINHVKVAGSPASADNSPGVAVYIKGPNCNGIRFVDCTMSGNEVAIQADACNELIVSGVDFGINANFCPASKTGLLIAAGVKGRLSNCRFTGVGTPFINNAPATFLMDEWQDWGPAVTSGVGAFGAAPAAAGRYRTIGNRVEFRATINISSNGSAAQDVRFTLPPPVMIVGSLEGFGRTSVTGRPVTVEDADATHGVILDATNAYPGGAGVIRISGSYEIATPY